jgi:site-specific DNA-methyltransferase (adenine-specific)
MLTNHNYNPDVLTCIANLSSDEVFTPPQLANQILDLLPAELWGNGNAKFLDPACKSGVFLREIAKRLDIGLEKQIPDRQERMNHIFKNQLFALAITELTALLSRRSVYCSKTANGKYSVCDVFNKPEGNIHFGRVEHTWENGRCVFCGANEENYERGEELETHAYRFIHTETPEEIFNMKFDVIIGNPPYQMNDGGGTGSSARPIYNLFVERAMKMSPRYLTMIIPARWYSGGKGLDDFRNALLSDRRIRKLVDYPDSRQCFPGVDIAGGVCYFLWERDNAGICEVETKRQNKSVSSKRYLNEFDVFVRDNTAVDIINKVRRKEHSYLNSIVSSRMPFGLNSGIRPQPKGDLTLVSSSGTGKISSQRVSRGKDLIGKWKVLLSKASHDHGGQPDKEGKRRIFSRIEVMDTATVCTESYLVVGSYDTEEEAINMAAYLRTKFCRFLVSTVLLTQNITKGMFAFVPNLPMTEAWTDEMLFNRYNLTRDEITNISEQIRPMSLNDQDT